jgi:vitamin B12 transporter
MKLKSVVALSLAAQFVSVPSQAQESPLEQVIVTATRAGEGVRRDVLGASITVLEPDDLEQRQTRLVSDVLRDVPGVAVGRAGTVGGLTQVRVRGTEGNHVLVLIDGMEASDPYSGEFDFAVLLADEVARIEVLRGQQSALYGSDAIGGVIHYMTASGKDAPGVRARVEAGSFDTVEGAARFAGSSGVFDYAVSAGYQTTDGVPTSRFGTRKLGAENSTISGRFELAPTDTFRLKAVTRYTRTEADLNDQDYDWPFDGPPSPTYGFVIDSDDHYDNRAFYGLLRAELDSLEGRWRNAVSVQGADADREMFSEGALSSSSEGARLKASYESSLSFGSDVFSQTLTAALDFERERMQNTGPVFDPSMAIRREIDNTGVVLQYDAVVNERVGFGAALRYDDNDRFDNATTYRVQGSYRFDGGTRLRAAAGSGIKNPSMTELFGYNPSTFIGNPDLKPEKSKGWEAGIEQSFAEGAALIGVTYFDSTLENEIYTDFLPGFMSTPGNRATESTQEGVEFFGTARLGANWRIDASYTYLDAQENGVEEVRRPKNIASLNVGWRVLDGRAGLQLTVRYNGEMYDNNWTLVGPPLVVMPEFTLVNLGGDFRINDSLSLYGRVENLLDEEYEEVYTYRTPGRAVYFGVRASF